MPFWTYMLHCRGGKFYTGHTDNLDRRIAQHQSGTLDGWTKALLPVELVWSQELVTRYEAISAERQIKGWSRAKKKALVRGDWKLISSFAKSKDGPSTSSGQTVRELRSDLLVDSYVIEGLKGEAATAHPHETCGLLYGTRARITAHQPAENIHQTPHTHFEIDPAALIAAHRAAREGGPQIIGYYHSHPNGLAAPSETDARAAADDGRVWAIIAGEEITFWRDTAKGFEALSYIAEPA